MRRRGLGLLPALGLLLGGNGMAWAVDVPITGLKLIVVDRLVAAGKAKVVFVAKDTNITKGTGTDPTQIAATLDVAYDSMSGTFDMPQGSNWLVKSASVGKYVNRTAPTGGAVKVSVLKPASLVKVVGKSLGDTPLDISSAPTGNVYVVDTIVNDGETTRLCTQFSGCVHKVIAGDTGHKLICKGNSTGDAACTAAVSTTSTTVATTTTTSSTTSTTVCLATAGTFCDLGDGTVYDSATNLQWERKGTTVGSGVDAGNLHDVDNTYRWGGTCSVATSKRCQPNLAAETACKAQTDMAHWASGCEQCTGGEGTCIVPAPAITTAWDWLAQVNVANYAGHNDWRLPSESGCNTCFTNGAGGLYECTSCDDHELETILLSSYPCGTSPCIDPLFGPTASNFYWSASTDATGPTFAWLVNLDEGFVYIGTKAVNFYVRAVRDGS